MTGIPKSVKRRIGAHAKKPQYELWQEKLSDLQKEFKAGKINRIDYRKQYNKLMGLESPANTR